MPPVVLFFLTMCGFSFLLFCGIALLLSPELVTSLRKSFRLWRARRQRDGRGRPGGEVRESAARAIERVYYFD